MVAWWAFGNISGKGREYGVWIVLAKALFAAAERYVAVRGSRRFYCPRLQNKKWEEHSKATLVRFVEQQAQRKLSEAERRLVIHGAEEVWHTQDRALSQPSMQPTDIACDGGEVEKSLRQTYTSMLDIAGAKPRLLLLFSGAAALTWAMHNQSNRIPSSKSKHKCRAVS